MAVHYLYLATITNSKMACRPPVPWWEIPFSPWSTEKVSRLLIKLNVSLSTQVQANDHNYKLYFPALFLVSYLVTKEFMRKTSHIKLFCFTVLPTGTNVQLVAMAWRNMFWRARSLCVPNAISTYILHSKGQTCSCNWPNISKWFLVN